MGDSLYFNYVFFLTIGFGNPSPRIDAGKVFFILWALLDVPIMTSFVVQTVPTIVERVSKWLASTAKERRLQQESIEEKYFIAHVEFSENDEFWDRLDMKKVSHEHDAKQRRGFQENITADDRDQTVEITDVETAIDHGLDGKISEKRTDRAKVGSQRNSTGSTQEARRRTSARDDNTATKKNANEMSNRKPQDYAAASSQAKHPSQEAPVWMNTTSMWTECDQESKSEDPAIVNAHTMSLIHAVMLTLRREPASTLKKQMMGVRKSFSISSLWRRISKLRLDLY